jgi:hypothetical protein
VGAHPYRYVVAYSENPRAALERLRQTVFEQGQYHGAENRPRTPEEALEASGETGTRSILDITRIGDRPDFGCAAPLTPAELERYFGTATPTVGMVEECDPLWEELERGKARYVVTYEEGVPRSIVFVGYSFD